MKCHFLVDYIVLNENFPQKHLTFKSFHRYLPFISQFRCILFDVNNSCCNFSFDFLSLVANWQHPVTFSELEYSFHDCSPKKSSHWNCCTGRRKSHSQSVWSFPRWVTPWERRKQMMTQLLEQNTKQMPKCRPKLKRKKLKRGDSQNIASSIFCTWSCTSLASQS